MNSQVHLLSVGEIFHDRYEVVSCLAAGGMGAVYDVRHTETHRRCALKVMLPDLVTNPELRRRFQLEARVTANVDSEHLTLVFDAGVDEAHEMPFLVMELLRGEDLGQVLEREGRLGYERVISLMKQVAMALDKTHAAGIIHRDLKPENLFVTTRDDGTPWVKILDFGIAKFIADSASKKGTHVAGTPMYMSPEQIRGDAAVGPGADLYALAHIVYALLVGAPYWFVEHFEHGAGYTFLERVIAGVRELPSRRAGRRGSALPATFDDWFLQATAADPTRRFRRATEMIEALTTVIHAIVDEETTCDDDMLTAPTIRAKVTRHEPPAAEEDSEDIATRPTLASDCSEDAKAAAAALAAGAVDDAETKPTMASAELSALGLEPQRAEISAPPAAAPPRVAPTLASPIPVPSVGPSATAPGGPSPIATAPTDPATPAQTAPTEPAAPLMPVAPLAGAAPVPPPRSAWKLFRWVVVAAVGALVATVVVLLARPPNPSSVPTTAAPTQEARQQSGTATAHQTSTAATAAPSSTEPLSSTASTPAPGTNPRPFATAPPPTATAGQTATPASTTAIDPSTIR